MNISIPKNVSIIIDTLNIHGYEAYVVGGCVRDSILGECPADWDITTSGRPEQVKELFSKTIDTGMKHGTVTVLIGKEGYEVTTFRLGVPSEDTQGPEASYADSLEEDLQHRDFTINAMAYHPKSGLIDPTGGLSDLEQGLIRCVGDAGERFAEDPLRMLRAIRFAGQFHFRIDGPTLEAIRDRHKTLSAVSAERIQMELLKLLISDHPEAIKIAYETGLTSVFLPEFDVMMNTEQNNPHHCYTVGEHTIRALCLIESNPILRLTILFHDIGKPKSKRWDNVAGWTFHNHNFLGAKMIPSIFRRMKLPMGAEMKYVQKMVELHMRPIVIVDEEVTDSAVRRLLNDAGDDIDALMMLCEADITSKNAIRKQHFLDICLFNLKFL